MPAFGKTKEQILAELFPGKTEEQLKEMAKSFDELKAKAEKVTKLESDFAASNTELATVKAKLIELEAKNQNNNQNQNQNNNNNNNNNVDTRPDWGEDADAAFQDRSKPLVALTLETRAEAVYDRVVRNLEKDPYFEKFRKEFDEIIKKGSVQQRASQEFVENCYNVVYARHRNEILRDVRAGSGEFFVETGRNQNNNQFDNNRVDVSKTLTEEEKKEAAKFGVSPEKWLETRNKIKFVGGGVLQNM